MRVFFTGWVNRHSDPRLRKSYAGLMPAITQIARGFEHHRDQRALVVVLACPCCRPETSLLSMPDAVLVSPMKDVQKLHHHIRLIDTYPPHGTADTDSESSSDDAFLTAFRTTINRALAEKRQE